jgi:hypothetical protein
MLRTTPGACGRARSCARASPLASAGYDGPPTTIQLAMAVGTCPPSEESLLAVCRQPPGRKFFAAIRACRSKRRPDYQREYKSCEYPEQCCIDNDFDEPKIRHLFHRGNSEVAGEVGCSHA